MFSSVSFVFNVTAEQFSLGDVILHVIGSSKWEYGASVISLELHEFSVGHDSIIVRLSELVIVKLWKSGSLDWLVVAFMELSTQQILFTRWISLLNALVWFDTVLSCGRSKFLLVSLFTGYKLFPFFITWVLDSVSTIDTRSVVIRSLVAQ